MKPLEIREGLVIPPEFLSVSFTRSLDQDDAVAAARRTPSVVELRFATRACPGFGPEELRRIQAHLPLRADRRGTVRVICGDFRSRARNLDGAREMLRQRLLEALERPQEAPAAAEAPRRRRERQKRGRAGLIKGRTPPPSEG